LLAELVEGFGPLPAMKIDRIGYGAGQKEFPGCPNILRLFVGEAVESSLGRSEQVCVLETQLDDAPGEWIGYCVGLLDKSGALDVYTTPIQMKKNRPGVLLSVLCRPEDASRLE